jgi:trimeric autotransporter adhesin
MIAMFPPLSCTLVRFAGGSLAALALSAFATAQCATVLRAGEGYPGTAGLVVTSLLWDPDGAGPRGRQLVIGGNFFGVGNQTCPCIATLDPVTGTWSTLGGGMAGFFPEVNALAVLQNGDLVAAGRFDSAGGTAVNNIARWDGTTWSPLGAGLTRSPGWSSPPSVLALTVAGNGDLVAGGRFDRAGSVSVAEVARWNGTAWSSMVGGIGTTVHTLTTLPNGDVVAGGPNSSFTSIGRWTGTAWVPLGAPMLGSARVLAIAANGDLLAGGNLGFAPGSGPTSFSVGRWNGTSWSTIPTAFVEPDALVGLANGDVLVGGAFHRITATVPALSIARWDGVSWSTMGAGFGFGVTGTLPTVRCITELPDGSVFAGGSFLNSGNVAMSSAARWDGNAWQPLTDQRAPSGLIADLVPDSTGGFHAATRDGRTAGGVISPRAAHWDGTAWQPMPGIPVTTAPVSKCMLRAEGIGLLVGGGNPGLSFESLLQRWTGSTWVPFGSPLNDVLALAQLPNGAIVASFNNQSLGHIATSTGGAWTTLGGGTNGTVGSLLRLRNGHLIAGGGFTQAGAVPAVSVARWNGSTWSALGSGLPGGAGRMDELPNGNLVAITYDDANVVWHVAEWNGATWTNLGSGMNSSILDVLALPDGDVLAGGWFTTAGGVPARGLARWRGGAWHAVHDVVGNVYSLAMSSNGEIGVGGAFWSPATGSTNFVRLASGCAAAVTTTATACVGPAGPLVSAPTSLPWLGSTFRIRTTGYASSSIAAVLIGSQPANLLLSNAHSAGLPGCSVLTSPDQVLFALPVAGVVELELPIQNTPALIGLALRHQQLQAGLASDGAMVSLSSSNLLELLVGDF